MLQLLPIALLIRLHLGFAIFEHRTIVNMRRWGGDHAHTVIMMVIGCKKAISMSRQTVHTQFAVNV